MSALRADLIEKLILNQYDVDFADEEENGLYTSSCGQISDYSGADAQHNLMVVPPGKARYPFYCRHGAEEMFFILEGEGELRFGASATRSASTTGLGSEDVLCQEHGRILRPPEKLKVAAWPTKDSRP